MPRMYCPRCHRELPEGYAFCPHDGEVAILDPRAMSVRAQRTKITDELLGGRYRVRGFIGRGAVARVYLGDDEQQNRLVAIKVLVGPNARDPVVRERLLREAATAGQLDHPNIVRVYDVGEREDGAPYLVLEFLFGESLGDYLRREGTMAAELGLPALRQAASALCAAHDHGIVHRDIKPDNLFLVGEPGDPYELKVLDFGLARLQTSSLTEAGMLLGSPTTMAPEQILGEPVDARTDVYALGMVMYRMLAGRYPFDAADEVQTIAHHIHTAPRPPSSHRQSISPRLDAVVLAAIRKRPAQRYPAMNKLLEDLDLVDDPNARLWAEQGADQSFTPANEASRLLAASLLRVLQKARA